jgi:hypothetical protein
MEIDNLATVIGNLVSVDRRAVKTDFTRVDGVQHG